MKCPACAANGIDFDLTIRLMDNGRAGSVYLSERGMIYEGACSSCAKCFGISRDGHLDRLPLPWNVDSRPREDRP